MKRSVWILPTAVALVAIAALLTLWWTARRLDPATPSEARIEYYKLYLEAGKTIVIGVGAALLGILIPAMVAEARYSFERLRDSRRAYSEAKTAGDYLGLRLCTLSLKDACALLQEAHVKKHIAELYPELEQHLRRRGIQKTPEQWGDGLYSLYFDTQVLLEAHAEEWDTLSPAARLSIIRTQIPPPTKGALVPGAVDPTREDLPSASANPPVQPTGSAGG